MSFINFMSCSITVEIFVWLVLRSLIFVLTSRPTDGGACHDWNYNVSECKHHVGTYA